MTNGKNPKEVTPFAGVWIEISFPTASLSQTAVTPFAGVWIEIDKCNIKWGAGKSHSLRGSVDWNYGIQQNGYQTISHSLRGSVDWNPFLCSNTIPSFKSLPSRECGLKSEEAEIVKLIFEVTPFAGVWIEILHILPTLEIHLVTPFAGVWIEISLIFILRFSEKSHSLRGSVDWNCWKSHSCSDCWGHSLRGSVDWNKRDSGSLKNL